MTTANHVLSGDSHAPRLRQQAAPGADPATLALPWRLDQRVWPTREWVRLIAGRRRADLVRLPGDATLVLGSGQGLAAVTGNGWCTCGRRTCAHRALVACSSAHAELLPHLGSVSDARGRFMQCGPLVLNQSTVQEAMPALGWARQEPGVVLSWSGRGKRIALFAARERLIMQRDGAGSTPAHTALGAVLARAFTVGSATAPVRWRLTDAGGVCGFRLSDGEMVVYRPMDAFGQRAHDGTRTMHLPLCWDPTTRSAWPLHPIAVPGGRLPADQPWSTPPGAYALLAEGPTADTVLVVAHTPDRVRVSVRVGETPEDWWWGTLRARIANTPMTAHDLFVVDDWAPGPAPAVTGAPTRRIFRVVLLVRDAQAGAAAPSAGPTARACS